jgi:hypothetical protein
MFYTIPAYVRNYGLAPLVEPGKYQKILLLLRLNAKTERGNTVCRTADALSIKR